MTDAKQLEQYRRMTPAEGVPDAEYLQEWARRLQVEQALTKAIADAGLAGS